MKMSKPLRVVFAGTPEFSVPTLQALIDSKHDVVAVLTQPDRPAGRGRHLHQSPVKDLALQHELLVFQPTSLKDDVSAQMLRSLEPDVLVVVAYGLLLPKKVLEIPKQCCINVHASILPKWRGASPIQSAILAGDSESGVTTMQMDVGLDTGDMLIKKTCTIERGDNAQSLHDKLAALGATALIETLTALEKESLAPEKQNDALATHAPKITKEMGRLDWHKSAKELARQVRAFNPWPVCFTEINGEFVRVWQAEVLDQSAATPGTVINYCAEGVDVATMLGALRLLEIQLPGKRKLSVKEIYNAKRDWLTVGQKIGGR